ncbi:MAG: hypothetical protein KJO07_10360, partial [Deltaproteobacteria bacterium]|nr:hypothetical protein [Deltaproteobacteria bacterium]
MQLRLLPVVAVLVLSIALGCSGKGDQSRGQTEEGGESVQLIDKDSGKLLTNTPVNVFLDDGIRCATDPCPTKSRSWVGQTDGSGRFSPPTIPKGWSASISVDGYRG